MTLVDPFFDVRQTANVQWRVRQNAVHPRKAIEGEESVEYAHHKQVQVVGAPFLQPKLGEMHKQISNVSKNKRFSSSYLADYFALFHLSQKQSTYLLQGLFTIAAEMFWSIKKSSDREKPKPAQEPIAAHGKSSSRALVKSSTSS